MILQQPIEREQMKKLLATGRTDLLTDFVSKKGRKFKAFLVKNPDGKIGFEFQPRKEKPAELKTAAEAKAKSTEEKPAAKKPAKKRRSA
jgi:DNA topoisomerase-3